MPKKTEALTVRKRSTALSKPRIERAEEPAFAVNFCRNLADELKTEFGGDQEDFENLWDSLRESLGKRERAATLEHLVGRLNAAFGAAGHVQSEELIAAVQGWKAVANELGLTDTQQMVDRIRALKAAEGELAGIKKAAARGAAG